MVCNLRHDSWQLKLRYLADLFEKLNELNLFLQGESTNVFTLKSKIGAIYQKVKHLETKG